MELVGRPVFIWPQGGWHSVRVSWNGSGADRSLNHWYINLHTPLQRSAYGFDMEDLILDVVVTPDLRSWSWKDEVAFNDACAAGIVDADVAAAVRDIGAREAAGALRGAEPFTQHWASWRPDPSWRMPTLPRDCARL